MYKYQKGEILTNLCPKQVSPLPWGDRHPLQETLVQPEELVGEDLEAGEGLQREHSHF